MSLLRRIRNVRDNGAHSLKLGLGDVAGSNVPISYINWGTRTTPGNLIPLCTIHHHVD